MIRRLSATAACLALALGAACAATTQRRSTSLVGFLYPKNQGITETPAVPVLHLPLRVGVAFVPPGEQRSWPAEPAMPEADRVALMKAISEDFKKEPYVKSIELIPSAYLQPNGGFENLDQLRNMFGIDVVALVSYDQVQFTDEKRSSLLYWTVVGAYFVEGEKNETRTLMDAAVYDIRSRRMLFRAPGVSSVKGTASPVKLTEEQRRDREEGFRLAAEDLKTNLAQQLTEFRAKVKDSPEEVKVVASPEYAARQGATGGGSVEPALLVAILALAGVAAGARRRGA